MVHMCIYQCRTLADCSAHTAQSRVVLPVRTGLDIWAKAEDLQQLVNESNESMKSKGSSDL